jgi:CRP-like cAMP-binding protein
MARVSSVSLFEVEPDLLRYVARDDRAAAMQTHVPLVELGIGDVDLRMVLESGRSFAALLLDGMLLQSLRLGEHAGLRLLGPGDLVSLSETPPSMLILEATSRATAPMRLALLGRELLLAARRWPWLIAGLHTRQADQADRLLTQMMICQLPRVDDRLLAMMWLMAESWGQVTASGTVLPIELTHSALGGLIGARRPTVTLALSELTERGAVVRQAGGWLLLEPPKTPARAIGEAVGDPRLQPLAANVWGDVPAPEEDDEERAAVHAELRRTLERMRDEYQVTSGQISERISRMIAAREELAQTRRRLREGAQADPRVPS